MKCIDCGAAIEHRGLCADCLAGTAKTNSNLAQVFTSGQSYLEVLQVRARQEQKRIRAGWKS